MCIEFLSSNLSSVYSVEGNSSHVQHEMIMQLIYYRSKLKLMKNASAEHVKGQGDSLRTLG